MKTWNFTLGCVFLIMFSMQIFFYHELSVANSQYQLSSWYIPIFFLFIVLYSNAKLVMQNDKKIFQISYQMIFKVLFAFGIFLIFWQIDLMVNKNNSWIYFGFAIFQLYFGYLLSKSEPNSMLSIKTKWNQQHLENWKKTHRFIGRLYIVTAIAIIAYGKFGSNAFVNAVIIAITPLIIGMFYSYYIHFNSNIKK